MDSCTDCGSSAISTACWWSLQFQKVVHNIINKLKPHFCLSKQENNRRDIKEADEHSESSMIVIWSQMKTIIETQHSIVPILFSEKKNQALTKQRQMNNFTSYFFANIDTNRSQKGSIFEVKIRNKSTKKNPQRSLVLSMCSDNTFAPYHEGSCSDTSLHSLATTGAPSRRPRQHCGILQPGLQWSQLPAYQSHLHSQME